MATQRYVPAAEVAKAPEAALPLSGPVERNTGVPAQVVSPGANSAKKTLPVGPKPPVTVAVSETGVPTTPPAEGAVEIAGVARVMVTGSSWRPVAAPALLASPR